MALVVIAIMHYKFVSQGTSASQILFLMLREFVMHLDEYDTFAVHILPCRTTPVSAATKARSFAMAVHNSLSLSFVMQNSKIQSRSRPCSTVCMTNSGRTNSTTLQRKFVMHDNRHNSCCCLYCRSCNTNEEERSGALSYLHEGVEKREKHDGNQRGDYELQKYRTRIAIMHYKSFS